MKWWEKQLYVEGCTGKVRHHDEKKARVAMVRMMTTNLDNPYHQFLNTYQCAHCGHWHVGHIPTAKRPEAEHTNRTCS